MQIGIELLEITKDMQSDGSAGNPSVSNRGMLEIDAEHLPGTTAEFSQKLRVKPKAVPQSFGKAEHPPTTGNLFEYLGAKPLTKPVIWPSAMYPCPP
jgi:hypothetical protein